jgi:hypothetical protein
MAVKHFPFVLARIWMYNAIISKQMDTQRKKLLNQAEQSAV